MRVAFHKKKDDIFMGQTNMYEKYMKSVGVLVMVEIFFCFSLKNEFGIIAETR